MKKLLFIIFCIIAITGAKAQTYLTEALTPIEYDGGRYVSFTKNGEANEQLVYYKNGFTTLDTKTGGGQVTLSGIVYKYGFTLKSYGGNTSLGNKVGGHVTFNLKGEYEKLSFVVWPMDANPNGDTYNAIYTVKCDGQKLLDEVMRTHDAPREFVLDVKGVDELRFDVTRGDATVGFGMVRLWKAGEEVVPTEKAIVLPEGKAKLVTDIPSHFTRHNGWVYYIKSKDYDWQEDKKSFSINRNEFTSGLIFNCGEALIEQDFGWSYFWIQKKYSKLSFIVGPNDNQSSNAKAWLIVKGDGKILYEELVSQDDLAKQVVLDVEGVNLLSFHSIYDSGDFLKGQINFGVVDVTVYPEGDKTVPTAGIANLSKEKLSKLPDVCKLISNVKPFSVRGIGTYNNTFFDGQSEHYTFSMGGEKFYEGFILTTAKTLFEDNIDSYVAFDIAGEFDWITFEAGCLTNHHVLDDDRIKVFADDALVLDTVIHATWPNQSFKVPVNKCRTLKFAKPGTGKKKQVYIGIGDIVLYRGKPVKNELFMHEKPDCPEEADLIDLCTKPYFHFVGRYLSSLNNLDINDCFKDGSTKREFFDMKDGSKIYKGVMLETNIPLGLEDISLKDVVFVCMFGAGSMLSSSDVAAATGISAGAGLGGQFAALHLMNNGGGEASVAAFNPFGEYDECTFSVANRYEYVPDGMLGPGEDKPVILDVFADQVLVGQFQLENKMQPTTYTVPINKCRQLMFWLECGEQRSGQYILYDMKVRKTASKKEVIDTINKGATVVPITAPVVIPESSETPETPLSPQSPQSPETPQTPETTQSPQDTLITLLIEKANAFNNTISIDYTLTKTWVKTADNQKFKIVTFVDKQGERLSVTDIQKGIMRTLQYGNKIKNEIADLKNSDIYAEFADKYGDMIEKCEKLLGKAIDLKDFELKRLSNCVQNTINVGKYKSTSRVLITMPLKEDKIPSEIIDIEEFKF